MANDVKVLITGDATGLFKALGDASAATKGMAKDMETAINGVKSLFLGFAAVLGGFEFLKNTVEETKNWTVEAQKLSRVLGITTEQASILNLAIGDIYGTQEEYLGAVAKLTKTLNTNEEAFRRLGVETRDQNGRLKDTPTIMAQVNQKLGEMKVGTDRNIASAQIYGKSWMEVQRYLKLTPEVMEEARAKAEKLNLIVGADAVAATDAYRASMNELEDTVKALKIRIGQELMPLMTEFNNSAAERGPQALTTLGIGINLIVTAFKSVVFAVEAVIQSIITLGMAVGKTMGGIWDAMGWATLGQFGKAKEAIKQGYADASREMEAGNTVIQKAFEKMGLELNYLWDPNLRPKAAPKPAAGGGKAAPSAVKGDDGEFEKLKAALEKERFLYEKAGADRGEFIEYKKSQEAAYWDTVLGLGGLEDKTRFKAQQEYYKAARAELKKNHDENKALDEVYRERYLADQKAFFDFEEQEVNRQLSLGRISDQEALNWKRSIEEQKYEVELAALQSRLAVKGLEPIEIAKLNGQIEALELQHRSKVLTLSNQQADLELQKNGWAGWADGIKSALLQAQNHFETFKQMATQVLSGVTNAFATGIQGILSGQMTLGQGMKAIWNGIVSTVIQAVAQLIAKWIVMTVVKKALGIEEAAIDGGRTAAALTTATAETWAAYASIPFAGPVLAMAQIGLMYGSMAASMGLAAGTGAATSAFGAGVYTAEGGIIDKPTLTLMGEAGTELVAPEKNFVRWAESLQTNSFNLGANLSASDGVVSGYGRQAAGFASAAPQGGRGPQSLVIQVMGHVLDTSERGIRRFGELVVDGARAAVGERTVVLRSGQVFGTV